jgi:hypothetical protein
MRRIIADKPPLKKIRVNPLDPRHPRSIYPYRLMKTVLRDKLHLKIFHALTGLEFDLIFSFCGLSA